MYGISAFNEEELIAREIALDADIIIAVVDATQLDRDLFLPLQLLDMGRPTVVALNMMDEAKRDGIEVDADALEASLGIPVVPTVAVNGTGVHTLAARIDEATALDSTPVEQYFDRLPGDLEASRAEKTLLVETDAPTIKKCFGSHVCQRYPSV